MTSPQASTRTSPRPRLTRESVLAAALAIADASGVQALSMRGLARSLGVEAMSLYHHVANKDALLDGIVDVVFTEIYRPDPARPWRSELEQRSLSARQALLRHRWAIGLMDSRRSPGAANLAHHDAVIACLRNNGFDWPTTATAYALLDAHLYGFLHQELALPFDDQESLSEVAGAITAPLDEQEFPHLQAFAAEHALQPGYSFGGEFSIGLDLVLDALERLVP